MDNQNTSMENQTVNAENEQEVENTTEEQALQQQLEEATKALERAESALELERKAHSELKRNYMSDEERAKEVERLAGEYNRKMNELSAERALVKAGLSSDDYANLLSLIVNEDAGKTEDTVTAIVNLLETRSKLLEKSLREKILKETPHPPNGNPGQSNVGIEIAKQLGKQASQSDAEANETLKYYTGG